MGWVPRFTNVIGIQFIEDNEHVGRCSTSRNAENSALVSEYVRKIRLQSHKSLRLHTSSRRHWRKPIRRKWPQFWQSDD
ncbi:hypothetical protein TNCV_3210091 [Trichonephila clavipes]|nr:hypothetical protein TNCV_3210091 [Trichonephila clavipes]